MGQVLLVAITGDRGLCGGYNTYAIKKVETRAAELKAQGIPFDMICIGNKGFTVSPAPLRSSLPLSNASPSRRAPVCCGDNMFSGCGDPGACMRLERRFCRSARARLRLPLGGGRVARVQCRLAIAGSERRGRGRWRGARHGAGHGA